jgi:dihydroflavonol-4-reductase
LETNQKSDNLQNKPLPIAVVTGANGFVGSHLVALLLQNGYAVRCILRKSSDTRWLAGLSVEIMTCGLDDINALCVALQDAVLVFHIAGVVKSSSFQGFIDGNVKPTENLLAAAFANKNSGKNTIQKILITSSMAAHGSNPVGKPAEETQPRKPVSEYGESKLLQEQKAEEYFDRLPVTIVRPPAVYGERDTEVLLFFQTLKQGLFPSAGVFQAQTLSLVHVSDLVRGMLQAAESPKSSGKIYFLGSIPYEYGWQDIARIAGTHLQKKYLTLKLPHLIIWCVAAVSDGVAIFTKKTPTINLKKYAEIIQPSWACSSAKAEQDFGYSPMMSLEKGIADTLDWYKKQGWL